MSEKKAIKDRTGLEAAVIGMAGRFPGAKNIDEFWENLKNGVESITFSSDKDLEEAGIDMALRNNPNYVKAWGVIEGIEYFDASFFAYTPGEAELLNPQARIFLRCCWEALEDAGYNPEIYDGLIGLYAGASSSFGWEGLSLLSGRSEAQGHFAAMSLTNKDFLCTQVSYRLNLKGPSYAVQTACSTSLVAIHLACRAILLGECQLALAGGVTAAETKGTGYLYQEGMVLSPDGHCRTFDARAKGTVAACGAGVVLLKLLKHAIPDRDHIYAMVKGSAINNDGKRRVGFTAPSVEGQAEVIRTAIAVSRIKPETISYVETHGTGTTLGDPIEIKGLKVAFNTDKKLFCAIGSVKTNIGHLDAAAGAAGFIKTVLALKHKLIPPSLYFEIPNPGIDFINSPFYIKTKPSPWEKGEYPRRAGVSSFGIGGTNAHAILEEWPQPVIDENRKERKHHLILLSARTGPALDRVKTNLAEYLKENPYINLEEVAYTLQLGRKAFGCRWMAVCSSIEETIRTLTLPGMGETHVCPMEQEKPEPMTIEPGVSKDRLTEIGRLWLHGQRIDWQTFYPGEKPYRISLPTYPFEGQRYWIDSQSIKSLIQKRKSIDSVPDISEWFYLPTWKRSILEPHKNKNASGQQRWLVFANDSSPGNLLVNCLKESYRDVVVVKIGSSFNQVNDYLYTVNPREYHQYENLMDKLRIIKLLPDKIIHLWNITGEDENIEEYYPGIAAIEKSQYPGFFSLLHMARALGEQDFGHDIHIHVLTNHVQDVIGNEPLSVGKSTILGLIKVIPQEYAGIRCSSIDIEPPQPGTLEEKELIRLLLEEFSSGSIDIESEIAYRGSQRWVQIFDPLHLEVPPPGQLKLRKKGIFLITGGLGKIGLMFAELFVKQAGARLILTGRSPFPSERKSIKIRKLTELREMGGEVIYVQADVADPEQMRTVVNDAEKKFGPINGIIHAAGEMEGQSLGIIRDLTLEDCQIQYQAKVWGTLVLYELFKDKPLDFCWMLSSISCVLGGLGFGVYASTNRFMDALVKKHNRSNPGYARWFTLNWDGMDASRSIDIFERMFTLEKTDQLVVSRGGNLQDRIHRWIKLATLKEKNGTKEENLTSSHPRPNLSANYMAPRNPDEKTLAKIWQNLLGYEGIGVKDDFMELGGDSLRAITVITQIHRELGVNIPVTEFFSRSTIEGLAQYISNRDHMEKDTYISIEPAEEKQFYALSSAQKRLYILHRMGAENNINYNLPYIMFMEGKIEKIRLEKTFKKLIQRHESLRTSFVTIHNEPVQRIHKKLEFNIEYFDIGKNNHAGLPLQEEKIINGFIRPFDLSKAPMLRVGLIKLEETVYILMVDIHHIIADGISLEIFIGDLNLTYSGEHLSPLKLHYKDFSKWQNSQLNNEEIKKQEEYWLKELGGELPVLNLPTDFPRPMIQSYEGKIIAFELSEDESNRLKEMAGSTGATLFMLMLSIYKVFLYKLCGQEDIIIGAPVVGRRHADLYGIIGFFVNTLAMRNHVQGQETFQTFLNRVKKRAFDAFENQDYQFEDLVDKIEIKRDMSRNPIFSVLLLFNESIRKDTNELPGNKSERIKIKPYRYKNEASRLDLTLRWVEGREKMHFSFEYCIKLFRQETIEKMIGYFKRILTCALSNPHKKIADIEIISKETRNEILNYFNENLKEKFEIKPIQARLSDVFQKYKKNTALEYGPARVTYAELEHKAACISKWIADRNIEKGSFIGIYIQDKIDIISAIIGILNMACIFVPLDTLLPVKRIENMIRLVNTRVILTDDNHEKILSQIEEKICHNTNIFVINDSFYDSHKNDENKTRDILYHPGDKIYAYFTSGTTGIPNVIVGKNESLVQFIIWEIDTFSVDETYRISQLSAVGFDAFLRDVFVALFVGGTTCIPAKNDVAMDSIGLIDWLDGSRINLVHCVPSVFRIINSVELTDARFRYLKYVLLSGEPINPDELMKWYRIFDGRIRLVNYYGPTETTMIKTFYFIKENDGEKDRISAGRPMRGTRVIILDKHMKICDRGIIGEIYIRTAYSTHGYLDNPGLNAQRFIRNPFTRDKGDFIYKTGDLGKKLENGEIEILGRIDRQVKIRGVRIELENIENSLLKHEKIEKPIVISRKTGDGENYLCAYIIYKNPGRSGDTGKIPTTLELREHLSKELPEYMIPSYFIPIEKVPLSSNGKIDWKALPDPEIKIGEEYIAPGNKIEAKLVEIWAEVLGIEKKKISINSNFFELGGHSLKATMMATGIYKELNVKVPLVEIFKSPGIKELSKYIKGKSKEFYISIEPAEEKEYYPLSPAQKRLYILQQMVMDNTGYNLPYVIPLAESGEIEKLESILKRLIERHESFRTSFITVNEEPVQRVHRDFDFSIGCHEVTEETGGVPLFSSLRKPFNLETAPLLRVNLISVGSSPRALFIEMHHIITDGTSRGILEKEFLALKEQGELPHLRLRYKDYSEWNNSAPQQEAIKQQGPYWIKEFSGEIPVLNLPIDYPRPSIQGVEGNVVSFRFNSEETGIVKRIAAENDSTLYMFLLAVFNVLLSKLSGQEDIIIGTPIAARRHAELQDVIGMFVNTLAMRNYPSADKTFGEFLKEINRRTLDAYENQEYPFEVLVDNIVVNRDASRNPVFDVMFNVLNQADYKADPSKQNERHPYRHIKGTSIFDMNLAAVEIGERIVLHLEYSTRLFKPETIERIIGYFKNIVKVLSRDTGLKISEVEIMDKEEQEALLRLSTGMEDDYEEMKTLHRLFEEQTERTPDNIAVIGQSLGTKYLPVIQLSYRRLNENSNRLAYRLREKGVGPDSIVGLMVERSLEMIIGMLGIMKAGGAYLPIDPEYPGERKRYMLEEGEIRWVLINDDIKGFDDETVHRLELIDLGREESYKKRNGNLEYMGGGSDMVYVIYTSGSTGKPKGAMVEHRNLVNLLEFQFKYTNIDCSRILQFSTISFDASFHEIFSVFLSGGQLCLVNKETRTDIPGLFKLIERNGIKTVFLPMSFLKMIFEEEEYINLIPRCISHIQTAGEQVVISNNFKKYLKERKVYLHNHYGPSETHVVTTLTIDPRGEITELPSIGKPVMNATIYIVDKWGRPSPPGVIGELWLGGVQVGRGYLNRPELTAEKFAQDKRKKIPGKKIHMSHRSNRSYIYRSGDLARWLGDGNIEFLGRIDHQVKIRGFRVEPGEIESRLLNYPGIKETVVLASGEESGDKYLCAYIVSHGEDVISQLREYLSNELPDYMIPSYFVRLEKIPLTPSGKVNREALPKIELKAGKSNTAPRNEIEKKLAELWSEILGRDESYTSQLKTSIGIDDNFFRLGGHSLKAMMLVSKIHKVFDVKVRLVELFKIPTIRGLSELITKLTGDKKDKFAAVDPIEEKEYYPLSSVQKRIYVMQQMQVETKSYNLPTVMVMEGAIDCARLNDTFQRLLKRHESLRTSFVMIEKEPVQVIHQDLEFMIEYYETGEENEQEIKDNFMRPFDLSRAPLLRVGLIKIREDRYILMADMHHIISDGVSHQVLVKEFLELYSGENLSPLRIQYKDFSRWQNRLLKSGGIYRQMDYWLSKFKDGDIPVLKMPLDYPRPSVRSFDEGEKIYFIVEEKLTTKISGLIKESNVSLYMILLAVFNILLSKYTGQEDIVVGSPIAGRRHSDLENIIGMFINLLAMRNQPDGNITFMDFLDEVKKNALEAYENQDCQFEQLVSQLGIQGSSDRNPLFDVVFAVLNFEKTGGDIPGVTLKPYKHDKQTSKFDLRLAVNDSSEIISMSLTYSTTLFKRTTAEKIIEHFIEILRQVLEDTDIKLKDCAVSHDLILTTSGSLQQYQDSLEF